MESSFLDRKSFTTPTQKILISKLRKKYIKQNIKRIKQYKPHFLYTKLRSQVIEEEQDIKGALKRKNGCLQTISSEIKIDTINVNNHLDHINENSSIIGKVGLIDPDSNTVTVASNDSLCNLQKNVEEESLLKQYQNSVINISDDQELFLRKIELQKKHCYDSNLELNYSSTESKLLKIKENNELLKTFNISKTTNVYKTVKKRNYLQIKPTETKPPEIMYENDGTEYYISSRTNRKRKRVDYVTLDHGLMYSEELEALTIKKQKLSPKDSVEVSANISSSDIGEQESNSEINKPSSPTQTTRGKWNRKRTKRMENQSDENTDNPEKVVTCAVCNLELDFTSWSYHKQRHHNNLAWRNGETPLDLNDEALVSRILGDLYKKRKPLYCEKCGVAKKSVVGFLSHKSMCLKTEEEKESIKVKCELCDRRVLPVSITTHMKFCHGNIKKENSEKCTKFSETESESDTHSNHASNDNPDFSKKVTNVNLKKEVNESQEKDFPDFVVCDKNDLVEQAESEENLENCLDDKISNEKTKLKKSFGEADGNDFFGFEHEDNSKSVSKKEAILQKIKSENQTQKVFTSLFAQIGEVESSSCNSNPVEKKTVPDIITPRRGRQPKVINEIVNSTDECNSKILVECAVCNNKMEQTNWLYHKLRRHNNLAWKVGDTPIDLNDHATVVYILNGIYKQRKPLYCEKCDTPRKSVMGYLSHKSLCQKTEEERLDLRVQCEYCDRKVMPVSMPMHLKYCRAINEKKYTTVNFQNFSKSKRNAATKAKKFIEEFSKVNESDDVDGTPYIINGAVSSPRKGKKLDYVRSNNLTPSVLRIKPFKAEFKEKGILVCKFKNCAFSSEGVQEFMKHFATCAFKPKDVYFCKICAKHFESQENVVEHIAEHSTDPVFKELKIEEIPAAASDSESDDEYMKGKTYSSSFPFRNARNVKFLLKSTALSYGKGKAKIFPLAFEWTKRFYEENYDLQNLFPAFVPTKSNWIPVSPVLVNQYLPPLRYSCSVARKIVKSFENPLQEDYKWKNYYLFESQLFEDGSSTIFCGGPVHAIAWAPTPPDKTNHEQYLAVAVANTVETNKKCAVSIGPGLIQIWNCGVLINKQFPMSKPELVICVAHNYGTVTAIEWCPSGCYDFEVKQSNDNSEELKRLGLLAVACSDSNVYIYSICIPHLLSTRTKVYKPKPVCQLRMVSSEFFAFSTESVVPTRLSWTKARGHRYLAIGYSNGMAAVFDLSTKSELLKSCNESDGFEVIRPTQNLKAHCFAITGISLFHLNEGRRWLMTVSLDRTCKFWDLESPLAPICEYKKFLLTDAVWLTNWLCSVVGPDDGGFDKMSQTCFNLVGSFGVSQINFFRNLSRVNSLSANDWNNGFLQGCISGEVTISVYGQLLYLLDMDKREKKLKNFPISYVGLVDKCSTIEERLEKHREEEKRVNAAEDDNQTDESTVDDFKMTYSEAVDKYGLVFCDFSHTTELINYNSLKPLPDCCRMTNLTVYPLTSVSKCSNNPNCYSYNYFACGYQAGFVRISYCDISDR